MAENALPGKLRDVLDTLALATDRSGRIELLVAYAERFVPVTKEVASRPFSEEHRVPGCESEAFVWAVARPGGKIRLYYAVENPQGVSAMALAAILSEALDGLTAEEIARVPEEIVYDIFGRELSMGKSMGLMGMVRATKAMAKRAAAAASNGSRYR